MIGLLVHCISLPGFIIEIIRYAPAFALSHGASVRAKMVVSILYQTIMYVHTLLHLKLCKQQCKISLTNYRHVHVY